MESIYRQSKDTDYHKRWSKDEDDRLMQAVLIHGDSCWVTISKFVGSRTNSKYLELFYMLS